MKSGLKVKRRRKKRVNSREKKLQKIFCLAASTQGEEMTLIKVAYFMLNFLNLKSKPIHLFLGVASSLSMVWVLKRLCLVKTTSWQHRFFDLTILSPIWLGTYECMKSSLENFFFGLKHGFQSGFFRFGQKFSNLTVFLWTWKNHYFEHFGGRQRLAGL